MLERAARPTGASGWPARPPLLELPTDRPRPAVQSYRGGGARLRAAAAALRERLRALARREGATLFMTLLAGLQALLARYAGRTTWWSARPIAGRDARARWRG